MKKLTKDQFETALKKSLEEIDKTIPSHFGVLLTMYKRLQFEKWLQIELFNQLAIQLKDYDVEVHIEYELSQKTSKRGQSIDIVVLDGTKEIIGLEMKIAPTNYPIVGFSRKAKRITNVIDDFIYDLDKTTDFDHSYSLALIFPFPTDKNHRNFTDFKKQESRMSEKGKLTIWDGIKMEDFITRYYLLSK
jgi:hypothetical protein